MSHDKNVANFTTTNDIAGDLSVSGDKITIGGQTIQFPHTTGTSGTYLRASGGGVTVWTAPSAADVGLGNVDNLSRAQLSASPTFTGLTTCADLLVTGTATYNETTDMKVVDNYITINDGETGAGVTRGTAGILVNRGTLPDYEIQYVEASQTIRAGLVGATQALATREDTPAVGAVPAWNGTTFQLDTALGVPAAATLQLRNIGAAAIGSAQWTRLGELDQSLSTASVPSFGGLLSGVLMTTAGTVSRSGSAVTGTGTAFTSAMIGGYYIPVGGRAGVVTGYTSPTAITVSGSQTTAAGTLYTIFYGSSTGMGLSPNGPLLLRTSGSTFTQPVLVVQGTNICSFDIATYSSVVQPCNGQFRFTGNNWGCDLQWLSKLQGADSNTLQTMFTVGADGTVSTLNNTLDTAGTGAASLTSLLLRATTAQLRLGTGVTVSAPTPVGNRIYTVPDAGVDCSFAMLGGAQTFTGAQAFSSIAARGALYLAADGTLSSAVLGAGQLLIGQAGGIPLAANLTPGTGITIGNTAGAITVATTAVLAGSSPTFGAVSLSAASGQLAMTYGGGNTATMTVVQPAGSYTYTVPDPGSSCSFVMTAGTQQIGGTKQWLGAITGAASSNQFSFCPGGSGTQMYLNGPHPSADRVYTFPDAGADCSVVLTAGAQTLDGVKTFSSPVSVSSTSSQLVFGSGFTTTMSVLAPSSSLTLTVPDPGTNANFVMTEGAQTINGQTGFGSGILLPALSGASSPQTPLGTCAKHVLTTTFGGFLSAGSPVTLTLFRVGNLVTLMTSSSLSAFIGTIPASTLIDNGADTWPVSMAGPASLIYSYGIRGEIDSAAATLGAYIAGTGLRIFKTDETAWTAGQLVLVGNFSISWIV